MLSQCSTCDSLRREIESRAAELAALMAEKRALESDLGEAGKLIEAQQADLDRYRKLVESQRPNQPERVPAEQIQLAFERVVATLGEPVAANSNESASVPAAQPDTATAATAPSITVPPTPKRRPRGHGRRRVDMTQLPAQRVELMPDEVKATGGEGWRRIGEEVSERVGFRPAGYYRLVLARSKWVRVTQPKDETPVLISPVPDSLWPRVMADPSAIANVIVSKYDDILPLNRQETISLRQGFALPRSTQCEWLGAAYSVTHRVVDAMLAEARAKAFCIATDSTGVRVRAHRGCQNWGMFVFIADRDHVVFRHAPAQDGQAVEDELRGFRGHLLADASSIFDAFYRDEHGMTQVSCWFHARRYWWRALETDRERALEALSLIGKLFEIERECRDVPMPDKTAMRRARAGPILDLFDTWIDKQRGKVDPRSPLEAAFTYYDNQRAGLRRFLEDGRLRLDNNISEAQLRNVVLGRHNWKWFENETGLKWYATFRSLIASCALHRLNPQLYLEQLLRLAPHWPLTKQLEISPKYWQRTVAGLDESARAIICPPWSHTWSQPSADDRPTATTISSAA